MSLFGLEDTKFVYNETPDFGLSVLQNRFRAKSLEHQYKRYEQRILISKSLNYTMEPIQDINHFPKQQLSRIFSQIGTSKMFNFTTNYFLSLPSRSAWSLAKAFSPYPILAAVLGPQLQPTAPPQA